MSEFFVDTSALAKRYVIETGSKWVRSWVSPRTGNAVIISALTTVEMVSLLVRLEREKKISTLNHVRSQNNFLRHADDQYYVIDLDGDVLGEARALLVKHPLRALDALQLASALRIVKVIGIQPTFISADVRLLTAAPAEGLPIDDPNAHP